MSILDDIKNKMWELLERWLTTGQSDNRLSPFTAEEIERVKSSSSVQAIIDSASLEMHNVYQNDGELEDLRGGYRGWSWYKEFLFEEEYQHMNRIRHIINSELRITKYFPLPWEPVEMDSSCY